MSTFGLPPDIRINLERSRLLLVDDNPQALSVESAMFRGFGVHRQYKAGSAKEAKEIVLTREVDLIVMDCAMPDMDGYDFVRWLRRETPPPLRYTPVIMLTGHTDLHNVRASLRAGVNEFLAKPFTAQALLDRIRKCAEEDRPFIRSAAYIGPWPRMSQVEGLSEAS